jgi:prepilin-type N-terminal cleavage/methylation domain-containing protein
MNSRPPFRFLHSAFTLVELLTVIAIIAILMGLLFPALTIVKDQANKVSAKTNVVNTVAAVKQYYTEYGKYPLTGQTTSPATDIVFGDSVSAVVPGVGTTADNHYLYDILRNYPSGTRGNPDGNPRQIVFFEGKAGIGTTGNPRNGFTPSTSTYTGSALQGSLYDPWGNEYAISVDGTYDNWSPVPYQDFPAPSALGLQSVDEVNVGCAAWSVGKDGVIGSKTGGSYYKTSAGTPSDDVISWQ